MTRPNIWMRLAAAMHRRAWSNPHAGYLLLVIAVTMTWIVTAMAACLQAHAMKAGGIAFSISLIADIFYAPFVYLAPDNDFAVGSDLGSMQGLARLTGPLVPILGLLWVARRHLLISLGRIIAEIGGKGYVLILSDGGEADAMITASAKTGAMIIVLDLSGASNVQRYAKAEALGVVFSRIPINSASNIVRRASAVVVWCDSDRGSFARSTDRRLRRSAEGDDIAVLIDAASARSALRHAASENAEGLSRLRPLWPDDAAVRAELANEELVQAAESIGHDRVSVCLWGSGKALAAAASTVLQHCWSINLASPRVLLGPTVEGLSRDAVLDETSLLRQNSAAVFGKSHAPTCQDVSGEEAYAEPVLLHLVDYGDDDRTVAEALRLGERLLQASGSGSMVKAIVRDSAAADALAASDVPSLAPTINVSDWYVVDRIFARSADRLPSLMHQAYAEKYAEQELLAAKEWRLIDETYVAANRAAADHASVKRHDWMQGGNDPEELMLRLARTEHLRWSAERLLDGWAPGSARDDTRRLHHCLVPWEKLGADDQQKDFDAVEVALRLTSNRTD